MRRNIVTIGRLLAAGAAVFAVGILIYTLIMGLSWRTVGLELDPDTGRMVHLEQRANDGQGEYTTGYSTQNYVRYVRGNEDWDGTGHYLPVISNFTLSLYGGAFKWCLREADLAAFSLGLSILFALIAVAAWVVAKIADWWPEGSPRERRVRRNGTVGERIVRWWRNFRAGGGIFQRQQEPYEAED